MKINIKANLAILALSLMISSSSNAQTAKTANLYAEGQIAPPQNFTGTVRTNMLAGKADGINCSVGAVTFDPGARTNWHQHPGGQVLIVTEGTGYYQEKGKQKRIIRRGDVIVCLPGISHWHGASSDSSMTHIATVPDIRNGAAIWQEKVTDQEYAAKL